MRTEVVSYRKPQHGIKERENIFTGIRRNFIMLKVRAQRLSNAPAKANVAAVPVKLVKTLVKSSARGLYLVLSILYGMCAVCFSLLSKAWNFVLFYAAKAGAQLYAWSIRHQNRQISRVAPAILLGTVTMGIIALNLLNIGIEVTLDGYPVGYLNAKSEMDTLIQSVEFKAGEYLGRPYKLDLDIGYRLAFTDSSSSALDRDAVSEMLFSRVSNISNQYVLTINGDVIGANNSKTALEMLKNRLLEARTPVGADNVKTEFVQEVKIEERTVANDLLMPVAQIEEKLSGNVTETQIYTVKDGDTVSKISSRVGMSISQIEALNPDLNINRISIGQQIKTQAAVPYLSVKQTIRETYQQAIAFETVTEKSDSMYTNQSKITRQGVNGLANVVADAVYVNGQEQERTVLEYTVVTEPVTQIKLVGTQTPPAKSPKGTFIQPFRGSLSSSYGYRRSMGDFHTGVDWAGPRGSAIAAADGGTVTFAGWKGNYGYCVKIKHGDSGYETLYAHCSKLLVTVGQKVAQGETIAQVGSTGRSTGNHLHFEILINGKHVNPLKYVGKTYY